jgi:sulfite exporter TauE/SafE
MLAILLCDALPPIEVLSAWSERLVGAALIAVGLWALRRSARVTSAPHAHSRTTEAHVHLHVQRGPAWFRRLGHAHASFYLGVLHGIAGSSHFFGVLPALALPTRAAALTYIAAFGVGTVAAMTMFAAIVGSIGSRAHQTPVGRRTMMMAAATLAILVGGWWVAIGN